MKQPDKHNTATIIISLFVVILILSGCSGKRDIRESILRDKGSFYYIDTENYPEADASLPVGIFDSGTGGLSVLADIIKYPGLTEESYIYMGDLANMPYGSYAMENNTPLLIEHVLKDVQFLLGNRYYRSGNSKHFQSGKEHVKAIVIACNTATAYAIDTIKKFLKDAGLDIGVIGVIEAGARGAFSNFSPGEEGSIAIMATDGTVRSGAYPEAVRRVDLEDDLEEAVNIFQQAGIGIAEAIDESPEAIDRNATKPRNGYKGPSDTGSGVMKIDTSLWERYDFDLDNGALLFDGEADAPYNIQLNSVENYIAFHIVSLLEMIRATPGAPPLNSIILACTHYPFYSDTFKSEISRLKEYSEKGEYIYRSLIADDLTIVNPATEVAKELYTLLLTENLLSSSLARDYEFYVSVPNQLNRNNAIRTDGTFTYEYKYGRKAGEDREYVKVVPFSRASIPDDILSRLSVQIPEVYDLMADFDCNNTRTEFLREEERIFAK